MKAWILPFAIASIAPAAFAQSISIEHAGRFPVAHEAAVIAVDGEALDYVEVTYRPGSEAAKTVRLPGDGSGRFAWTPTTPGLASATAHFADGRAPVTRTVSVAFSDTWTSGVWVMLLAAMILFGGAFLSLRAALRDDARLGT